MGNLSNQYISQSFQSLLHLGSDTTASATLAEIQDALGNGTGVFVSTQGNLKVTNAISASIISASSYVGIVDISAYTASNDTKWATLQNVTASLIAATGSYATTGSNNFVGTQNINGAVNVTGILTATEIHTLIESSSVIFSSGSNILGDSTLDTQTLIGTIIMSGSSSLTGSMGITGNISSSTLSGVGNVTNYSASVNTQLVNLSSSQSVDNTKWTTLGTQSGSWNNTSLNAYTASNDTKWTTLGNLTGSLSSSVNQLNVFTSSTNIRLNSIEAKTGSYATTGSNTFVGTEIITGSLILTGSVYGNVLPLSITSQTASINFSSGNSFTITLVSGSNTRVEATNIGSGQTINLLVTQPAVSFGTLTFSSTFKFPAISAYTASNTANAVDMLSFATFSDNTKVYSAAVKNLV